MLSTCQTEPEVRSKRLKKAVLCWATNMFQSKSFLAFLGDVWEILGPSLPWPRGELPSVSWEFTKGHYCPTREAQCEMAPTRKSRSWEGSRTSSWCSARTLGKWPSISALNLSIRSTLLEFLLNYTNHPQDPGQLDEKMFHSPPFPLSSYNEGA